MSPPKRNKNESDFLAYGGLLHRITNRIRQSLELQEILSATVAEIRSLLQTDRVKVYRFHPDRSGQVIAESLAENRLPSLVGLNFPAGDIPPQAREMFVKVHQRSIVDVATQRIILSRRDAPPSTGELTFEDLRLQLIAEILQRPVDPCHVDYLTAMGVVSSLVVPILHQDYLWGFLVSHHSQPQVYSENDLQLIQLIADQLSIAIAQSELLTQTRQQVRQETLINQITHLLHLPRSMPEILQLVLERIVRAASGSCGRLYLTATSKNSVALYSCGTQPRHLQGEETVLLEDNAFWQQHMQPEEQPSQYDDFLSSRTIPDPYQNPQLASLTQAFQSTRIRGMLVMPLRHAQESLGCLTIFRNAVAIETLWAGYWDQDQRQQRPRESFQVWRECKQSQPPEWIRQDIELIEALGIHLAMAIMQNRLYQLEKRNLELEIARAVAEEARLENSSGR